MGASRAAVVAHIAFALVGGTPLPAAAWQSEVHTALIQLSNNLFTVPGVLTAPDRTVTIPSQVPFACENFRANVYFALICGADAPDKKKTWFRADSHERDARDRAKNALACSIHRLLAEGVAERVAAEQLGQSIHYLQDIADPTNNLGAHRDDARVFMGDLLANVLRAVTFRQGVPPELYASMTRARAEVLSFTNAEQVIAAAQQVATVFRPKLAMAPRDTRTHFEIIAYTVALQERWVEIFDAGRRDWASNPDYWRDACMRRGPLTPEGPLFPAPPSQVEPALPPRPDLSRCFSRDGRHNLCRQNNCNIPERRERVCQSRDGRHRTCQQNGCNPVFRNPDGTTYRIPCYWEERVIPAVPCYWQ